jgi:ZIP family zinc transporter
MFDSNVLFALGLTLFAGLSTGIGSIIAFFAKKTSTRFLSVSLGFSAGVMIYVSMIEIFFKAQTALIGELGKNKGAWITVISFFAGMFLIAIIDRLIPSAENPHEMYHLEDMKSENCRCACEETKTSATADNNPVSVSTDHTRDHTHDQNHDHTRDHSSRNKKLLRMGVFTALAVAIHNFPEGLATFISALQSPTLAIPIAIAIAIHNIPEGIAVSVPVYYATGSKRKAFKYSFLSGLSEPVGAIVGYLILMPFLSDVLMGIVFAAVAGIMVFISLDELLPSAREYGEPHLSIYGMVAGMVIMSVSLLLMA